MTSIPMKKYPFTEKITGVRIVNQETAQLLGTVNKFDYFPGSISLVAFVDFFNVIPNADYILSVSAHFPDGASYPVHATRIFIDPGNLLYPNGQGYGKSTGNFAFNFTIERPSDFFLLFTLIAPNNEQTDTFYSYHTFTTR